MEEHLYPFLVLASVGPSDQVTARRVIANLRRDVDRQLSPLWEDRGHIGMLVSSALRADQIWARAKDGVPACTVLVMSVGPDWAAESAQFEALKRHTGGPPMAL